MREDNDELKADACRVILRAWKSYKMKKTFSWLKSNLLKAQHTGSSDILRRLSPKEAQILKDPTSKSRIRFRFGGTCFPPIILYKIYTQGTPIHYFSGQKLIKTGSQAAIDSCIIMGPRTYFENVLMQEYHRELFDVYEDYEVGNQIEVVRYLNSLDQRPPNLGGRNNNWRELTVSPFSTQSIQYDLLSRKNRIPYKKKAIPRKDDQELGEIEDEFGLLYEWTNNLSLDHLVDYTC
jgi:hypothetical protein